MLNICLLNQTINLQWYSYLKDLIFNFIYYFTQRRKDL